MDTSVNPKLAQLKAFKSFKPCPHCGDDYPMDRPFAGEGSRMICARCGARTQAFKGLRDHYIAWQAGRVFKAVSMILLAVVLSAASAHAQTIAVENTTGTTYTGTARGGLYLPAGLVRGPLPIEAIDASGDRHPAAVTVTAWHPDGSVRWALVEVTSTMPPGRSTYRLAPARAPPEDLGADVVAWLIDQVGRASIVVDLVDYATGDVASHRVDLSSYVHEVTATRHRTTPVSLVWEWSGDVADGLGWRLIADLRRGEPGARLELLLESHRRNHWDAPNVEPLIIRRARFLSVDPLTVPGPTVDIARGYNADAPATRCGHVGVADGAQIGPLSLAGDENGAVVVEFISPSSAIPMGASVSGTLNYANAARPGDPIEAGEHDPRSAEGLFLYGGQKLRLGLFIGSPDILGQPALDDPPTIRWANPAQYAEAIPGGLAPVYRGNDDLRARVERIQRSYVDPAACDPYPSTGERITADQFRDRGGTYPVPADRNPMFGLRDYGDIVWSNGYSGGDHYRALESVWSQFLRGNDARFAREARIRAAHQRTVDTIWPVNLASPTGSEGAPVYESGRHHGNARSPNISHAWIGGMALDAVMTGHPESLRAVRLFARWLVRQRFSGAPVPPDWAEGTDKDPRDWGAPSGSGLYGMTRGGSAASGWQGDWGQRGWARAGQAAATLDAIFGDGLGVDLRAYMRHLSDAYVRVEGGVWGRRGSVFNRARRGNGGEDDEQFWQLAACAEALGWFLARGVVTEPAAEALYDRMIGRLASCVWRLGPGVPPRPWTGYTPDGPTGEFRAGLRRPIGPLWTAYRNDPTPQRWAAWLAEFESQRARLNGMETTARFRTWPKWLAFQAAVDRVSAALAVGDGVTTGPGEDGADLEADIDYLHANRWTCLEDWRGPGTNFCTLISSVLGQAVLDHGREDVRAVALELAATGAWFLDEGDRERANPPVSIVSFSAPQYPDSQTKITAGQQIAEARGMVRLFGSN